jgi:hypothetical protein
MNFYTEIKQMFKMPTPLQVAANELANAELELLKAETGVEFASSLVTFNKQRVTRLKAYMAAQVKAEKKEQAKEES